MRARLRRLGREERGQAMAEYGIVLALLAGLGQLEHLAHGMFTEPRTALLVGIGLGIAVGYVFTSSVSRG